MKGGTKGEDDDELEQMATTRLTIADIPPDVLASIPPRTLTKHDISKLDPGTEGLHQSVLVQLHDLW